MTDLRRDVRALHILLSYMWEDVHFEKQEVVEVSKDDIATMMDLINRISDQLENTNV